VVNDTLATDDDVEGEERGEAAGYVEGDDPFASAISVRTLRQRRSASASAIVDPKARELVEAAAKSAGLTLRQLLDLIVDGELLAVPPLPSEITQSMTLGDLGQLLHAQAAQVSEPERIAWFAGLLPKQRVALVVALRHDGYAAQTIASQFGINVKHVTRAYTQYADSLGEQVLSVRLTSIAGMIELAAQRAQQGSVAKDDWGTYWKIEKDKLGMLQDLGIVRRAISQVEITHKLDDAQAEEVRKMVEIERKRDVRREEIKLIDAEVTDGDALPEGDDE
jgi:uncharacterized ubiquitin-like protein YukD